MLAKTADALTAYLGKPVLAEVGTSEEGTEWVTFGIPLQEGAAEESGKEGADEPVHVQMGGPDARLLGARGGLPAADDESYDCLYLWAIQITLSEGERFVKLDHDGEESAWSDSLEDVLPFVLNDGGLAAVDGELMFSADDDEDEDDDDGEDDGRNADGVAAPRH
jgi:hypothetical protein